MTQRYEALDSWRGICALLVALYHSQAETFSHLSGVVLIGHSTLFVDFFFVLSGFVIAGNYGVRLAGAAEVKRFMWLRLGRIYPLHVTILALFVLFEVARLLHQHPGELAPFTGPRNAYAILSHLLLLQGFPLHSEMTWNVPSWSIGLEFYTYLLFALLCWLGGLQRWLWVVAVGLLSWAGLALLAWQGSHTGFEGALRCVSGFMIGALCWHVLERRPDPYLGLAVQTPDLRATALELLIVVAVVVFVSHADQGVFCVVLTPLLFAATVLIFAREAGWISQLLRQPWALRIGAWSYSIYMVHVLVQMLLRSASSKWLDHLGHGQLFHPGSGAAAMPIFGNARWQGDLYTLIMILVVLGVSALAYRFIEVPGRDWFKHRNGPKPVRSATASIIVKET